MHAKNLSPQTAVNWIGDWHDQILEEFLHCRDNLPSWGPKIDRQSPPICGSCILGSGSGVWSFETHRYFGTQGPEIQKSREIYTLPRIDALAPRPLTHRAESLRLRSIRSPPCRFAGTLRKTGLLFRFLIHSMEKSYYGTYNILRNCYLELN
jgi:hypothetical protein